MSHACACGCGMQVKDERPADWGDLPWLNLGDEPCPGRTRHTYVEVYSASPRGYGHVWECKACGRRVRVDSSD